MEPKPYKGNDKAEAEDKVCEPRALYGSSELYIDPTKRYTYADYLSWVDPVRRELVDGFVKLMSGPNYLHSIASDNIFGKMWSYVKKRKGKCKVIHAPFDVRLPKNKETADDQIYTVVQPDICVICDPSKIDDKGCIGAPDMVVEVQSPSTARYDLDKKLHIYEEAGVKEYWVVYPKNGLTVFILQDDGTYDDGTPYGLSDKAPVHTIKGLEIVLKELFED